MSIDRAALAAGAIRFASGISFLVDPKRADRWWGGRETPDATAQLMWRSMGYRDALIGGLCGAALSAAAQHYDAAEQQATRLFWR